MLQVELCRPPVVKLHQDKFNQLLTMAFSRKFKRKHKMKRRNLFKALLGSVLALSFSATTYAADMDAESKTSLDTVMAFMGAVGSGDMDTVVALMADDMVWQNEGDRAMPWIGPWNGKEEILFQL